MFHWIEDAAEHLPGRLDDVLGIFIVEAIPIHGHPVVEKEPLRVAMQLIRPQERTDRSVRVEGLKLLLHLFVRSAEAHDQ
jgi:hypothetical protein